MLSSTQSPGSAVLTGTFTLSLDGEEWTQPIAATASESAIASALESLSALNDVRVFRDGDKYPLIAAGIRVEFVDPVIDVPTMRVNGTLLMGSNLTMYDNLMCIISAVGPIAPIARSRPQGDGHGCAWLVCCAGCA